MSHWKRLSGDNVPLLSWNMKAGNDPLNTEPSHVPFKFSRRWQCRIHVKIHPDHCTLWGHTHFGTDILHITVGTVYSGSGPRVCMTLTVRIMGDVNLFCQVDRQYLWCIFNIRSSLINLINLRILDFGVHGDRQQVLCQLFSCQRAECTEVAKNVSGLRDLTLIIKVILG